MLGMRLQVVGAGEEPRICGVVPAGIARLLQARTREGNDVDAVAVVVEGGLVQQVRVDGVRRVHDRAVGRVAKGVAHSGNVGAAPLADGEALRDLFGDEVSEHREFAGEVVIDADDFFFRFVGALLPADEVVAVLSVGAGKIPAVSKRWRWVDHAGRNRVVRETAPLNDACRQNAAGAIPRQHGRRHLRCRSEH